MPFLENIRTLFEKKFILHPMEDNGIWFFFLEESDPSAKNFPKCRLWLKTRHALMIKLDGMFPPPDYFTEQGGKRTRCDYLLFIEEEDAAYFLFIELKSGNFKKSQIEHKFVGSNCFVDYCNSILLGFNGFSLITDVTEKRFVVISLSSGRKRASGRTNIHNGSNTEPAKAHYIQVERKQNIYLTQDLNIKQLIGENRP
ncbi:MAG: hypothetical protein G8345_07485 [Magnetococcales bacterium]|nr:hypothetical protein [Magnetococcales bacterium]NGZ26716.1 hypothetical protein [Magnetococcales bacterium]